MKHHRSKIDLVISNTMDEIGVEAKSKQSL